MRKRRLALILQQLNAQAITLVMDETGDRKKGNTTDYVAQQSIGNLGKIESGTVSVNADGMVGQLTFRLLFKVSKPKHRLKPGEVCQTKLQLAQSIIEELVELGFKIELVLADSLYGESHPFMSFLDRLKLPWVVAIRSNHGVWMPEAAEIAYSDWQHFERVFSDGTTEHRYIQETMSVVFLVSLQFSISFWGGRIMTISARAITFHPPRVMKEGYSLYKLIYGNEARSRNSTCQLRSNCFIFLTRLRLQPSSLKLELTQSW